MKLDEIEALARDGETDAASVLALIAVVLAAKERVRLRKAVRAHALGEGPLPHHDEIFAADEALDAALAQLEQSP